MKADLQIGKVAAQFVISTQTLRNWVKNEDLKEFFSASARGSPGKASVFNESDVWVVATIHSLLQSNQTWQEIADALKTGFRVEALPDTAAVVATTTFSSMQLAGRALSAEDRLMMVLEQLANSQDQLIQHQQLSSQKVEGLMREIADLRALEASARRDVELYEQGRLKPAKGKGRR